MVFKVHTKLCAPCTFKTNYFKHNPTTFASATNHNASNKLNNKHIQHYSSPQIRTAFNMNQPEICHKISAANAIIDGVKCQFKMKLNDQKKL